jgi:hypothetical protein
MIINLKLDYHGQTVPHMQVNITRQNIRDKCPAVFWRYSRAFLTNEPAPSHKSVFFRLTVP